MILTHLIPSLILPNNTSENWEVTGIIHIHHHAKFLPSVESYGVLNRSGEWIRYFFVTIALDEATKFRLFVFLIAGFLKQRFHQDTCFWEPRDLVLLADDSHAWNHMSEARIHPLFNAILFGVIEGRLLNADFLNLSKQFYTALIERQKIKLKNLLFGLQTVLE